MKLAHRSGSKRTGAVVPLVAIMMVALIGFLALAIDLGMLAISKTEAQNAADLAALTAARTLSGPAPSNQGQATTNAQTIVGSNVILNQKIQPATQMGDPTTGSWAGSPAYGSYDYNDSTQTFKTNFPATPGAPISAVWVQVRTGTSSTQGPASFFAGIFGITNLGVVTAQAQAVHRPRDVAMVMDLSGSMRFGTLSRFDFWTPGGGWYANSSNNPDPLVPTFMHYSSLSANMVGPSTNSTSSIDSYTISPSNITAPNASYKQTYVNNFYSNAAYATPLIRAFDSYTSSDGGNTWQPPALGAGPQLPPASYATLPGGDVPLFNKGSSTVYAPTVTAALGGATMNVLWELDGYSAYVNGKLDTSNGGNPAVWTQVDYSKQPFNGYTQGPGYFGKTFFIWPPDPRNASVGTGGSVPAVGTVQQWLSALGMTNITDQNTVASNWGTWTLAQLQSWMSGATTKGGPYKATGPFVTTSPPSQAPIYYAVCRLFNRAYPAGSSKGALVADWRVRFFGTNDNTVLFDPSSGSLNVNNLNINSLTINYAAILQWLAQSPNPFPAQMRAGRIKYYGSIPTQLTGTWPNYGGTDQRFWKESIDYMLGLYQLSWGYADISQMNGYNGDFTWGAMSAKGPPTTPPQYMQYTDNPARGQMRYWFGPMMMVDYLANYNMYEDWTIPMGNANGGPYTFMDPGDGYIAPMYSGKQAFLGAVQTMQTNHPNDWFALMYYNWPRSSNYGTGIGAHNCVACPLGTNYAYANSALFFPFSTINANGTQNNTEVTPYDPDPATGTVPSANFKDVPRASGDTCFAMGLMLAYNQFVTTPTSDATLRTFVTGNPITFGYGGAGSVMTAGYGMAGGLGRKGAQKVVIFETDGMPNCTADANLTSFFGAGYAPSTYYSIRYDMNRPTSSEYPMIGPTGINNPTVTSQITSLVTQLKNDFGTTRNPFRLYAIGFGPVFSGPDTAQATATLQSMQNTAGVTSAPYIVTGTDAQMTTNMTTAFTNILQNGVQIALTK